MDKKNVVLRIAGKMNALYIQRSPDWHGCEIWELIYCEPGDPIPDIGFPQLVAINSKGYTMLSPEQFFSYQDYLEENYGFDKEGELIGFNAEMIKV